MKGRVTRERLGTVKPGQDLVVAGYIARKGAKLTAEIKRQELSLWFSRDYLEKIISYEELELSGNLELWKEFGATECEPVAEGGIWTALWNLSGAYDVGIEFTLQQVPVKQETIEVCERYDLNPFRLLSDNCVVLTADNGHRMAEVLAAKGVPAAVIGHINPGCKREVYNGEVRGFMERPGKDEIYKIQSIGGRL